MTLPSASRPAGRGRSVGRGERRGAGGGGVARYGVCRCKAVPPPRPSPILSLPPCCLPILGPRVAVAAAVTGADAHGGQQSGPRLRSWPAAGSGGGSCARARSRARVPRTLVDVGRLQECAAGDARALDALAARQVDEVQAALEAGSAQLHVRAGGARNEAVGVGQQTDQMLRGVRGDGYMGWVRGLRPPV